MPPPPTSAKNSPASDRPRAGLPGEYFERFPKDRHQTEIESWRLLQSANIELTMKRLLEPIPVVSENR
jgi:hypothetical protein